MSALTREQLALVLPVVTAHRDGILAGEVYYGTDQDNLAFAQTYATAITELIAGIPLEDFARTLVIDLLKEHRFAVQHGAASHGAARDNQAAIAALTEIIVKLRTTGAPAWA